MLGLIARLRALETRTRDESAKAKGLFEKRGQILPRERIARLLDPGAPWLELCSMAGFCPRRSGSREVDSRRRHDRGIGHVSGVRAMIVASDAGIDAGAIQHMGARSCCACRISRRQTSCRSSTSSIGGRELC
jgi:geranyl-CoA carboxylase beta subunit